MSYRLNFIIISLILFFPVIVPISAEVQASGSTTVREIDYSSIITLSQDKIIGNINTQIFANLEIILDAVIFESSFNITFDTIDLKIMNKDYTDIISSIWFERGIDFNETNTSYPTYNINIPFNFTPKLLPEDTIAAFDIEIRGTYQGISNNESIYQSGTLATLRFSSNIQYIADGYEEEPFITLDTTTKVILLTLILIILFITRITVRYIKKKFDKNINNHLE